MTTRELAHEVFRRDRRAFKRLDWAILNEEKLDFLSTLANSERTTIDSIIARIIDSNMEQVA